MFRTNLLRATALAATLFFTGNTAIGQRLPNPDEFLPNKLGEQFTPHHWLVEYFRQLAVGAPQKMQLIEYGKTHEGRPLLLAAISSPENMRNLEQIRLNNLRRAGLLTDKPADNTNPIAIVWLSMNVHGNEPASSETSMAIAHKLVSGEDQNIEEWLKTAVVLIDPCVNPDGYHRYTFWYTGASDRTPNLSPDAREHNEPWPYGRVNHYLFDLNRDWAWATQTETQARLEHYHRWMPHVVPDFHEMGYNSPYYFAPAAQPYHRYITTFQRDFQKEIGKNHAKYFDSNSWLYYTREVFDLFYPSYGDTYPTFNGAIGMTYEQGGIRAGRAILLENGDTLTLKDRISHHLTTALSTVEVSAKNAGRLVQNFNQFFKTAQSSPQGVYKTFVIKKDNPKDKIRSICQLLDRHKIKYGKLGNAANSSGYSYRTGGGAESFQISTDDIVVSAFQPLGTLAQVLLEPESELVDSLTYDITAWSLLHAYGLDAYATKQKIEPTVAYETPKYAPVFERVVERPYAYLASWSGLNNARFMSTLLQRGVRVRVAREPFEVEGKKYERGTMVITRAENADLNERFDKMVTAAALMNDQDITPVKTGFMESGFDFGSDKLSLIQTPKIGIVYDEETDNNSFGQVWFFFENDLRYPVTQLHTDQVGARALKNYTHLVLTDGRYADLDSAKVEMLHHWVADGGRLILIGDALNVVEDKRGFALTRFAIKKDREMQEDYESGEKIRRRNAHFCDAERSSISESLPGAIFKTKLDNSHPLAFGMSDTYFSLKTSSSAYQMLKGAWNVGYTESDLQTLGFVGAKIKNQFRNSMIFAVQDIGRGNVIYLQDNPLFRNFWYQGKFLFSNAVLQKMR